MGFIQTTAPSGLRNGEVLSADNYIPERHIVIATLRNAAPRLGLSASVISTLDAMLSCLAPKRNHNTVFASNETLTFRRNGISDRTIRRHAAKLLEIGIVVRHDSPNGKRYTKHNKHEGTALRFGFDLTPLFARFHEIAAMASEVLREREQIVYLRAKIRVAANAILLENPNNDTALAILRIIRRKLSLEQCKQILEDLNITEVQAETTDDRNPLLTTTMAANDGQFVRHYHRSNKELIDKEEYPSEKEPPQEEQDIPLSLSELLSACPEANGFSLKKIETVHDVIGHARTLAPMIGITSQSFEAAQEQLGALRAAATVWAIMQFHEKINSVGAYFRSITTGSKSEGFSPEKLVRRLAKIQSFAS